MNTVKSIFEKAFSKAETIDFNPDWANGTGYFSHAVRGDHAPTLEAGETRAFTDDHGRKAIVIGTMVGNVVIFERFSKSEREVYVYNAPYALVRLCDVGSGALNLSDMHTLVGEAPLFDNVGTRLEALREWMTVTA